MTRRSFLTAFAGTISVTPFITWRARAQDVEFIRALGRAQQDRPASLTSSARIAAAGEPGTPLVIHGRLFAADGRTVVPNAIVFAYHTDREGHYNRPGSPAHSWRLRGWARTDADGRFEFQTIRPGAYPSRNIPAHVHFNIFNGTERFHAGEVQFDDDPILSASDRARSRDSGAFGGILPVRREGAVEHVDVALKVNPSQRF
jgi:protocatechuate 3,4-dioxygenase beta subunit